MIKLACINDKDKPSCIPTEEWLHEGEIYTCRKICPKSNGYILDEIDIRQFCVGMSGFQRRRFRLATGTEVRAHEVVKQLLKETGIL